MSRLTRTGLLIVFNIMTVVDMGSPLTRFFKPSAQAILRVFALAPAFACRLIGCGLYKSGGLLLSLAGCLIVSGTAFSFPAIPPPLLNRPVQPAPPALTPAQLQALKDQVGNSPDNQDQQDQAGVHGSSATGQTFEGCGLNRDAAIMKAEVMMTQAQGDITASGRESLSNDQYSRTTTENLTMTTNGPAKVISEQVVAGGRVCVRIAP